MKPRKLKKLTLNKTTIANLNTGSLRAAKGGASAPGSTCKCPTVGPLCVETAQCTGLVCTATLDGCETNDAGETCVGVTCDCATEDPGWTCQTACPYCG